MRPNVLIIMSDQHGRYAAGCYGHDLVRTPNIDRLAGAGVRFDAAYCPAPLCVPSRMSFMTARTPTRNRVWTNEHALDPEIPTWAHYFGLAGYDTALIGRMHFVGADQLHGFVERPIGEFGAGPRGAPREGERTFEHYPGMAYAQNREAASVAGSGRTLVQWNAELVRDTACSWIRDRATAEKPFAAVVGVYPPHSPYIAPNDLFDYYYDRTEAPSVEEDQPATIRRLRGYREFADPALPAEQVRAARAAYFALCEYTDRLVGDVLDTLDQSGLAESTIVVYCSDHGDLAGNHGIFGKSCYYEEAVGVPLVLRYPRALPGGETSGALVSLMDIGPTMLDAVGATAMHDVDGRSFWGEAVDPAPPEVSADAPTHAGFQAHLDEAGQPRRRSAARLDEAGTSVERGPVFAELLNMQYRNVDNPSRMIRDGRFKLWVYDDDDRLPPSLYDLAEDPGETHNLAADPEHADTRARLLELVYANWDPRENQRAGAQLSRDAEVLAEWGALVRPPAPHMLAAPEEDVERDIVLHGSFGAQEED